MSIFSILVDVGCRTAQMEEALTRVEGRLSSFSSAVGKIGSVVGVGAIAGFAEHIINLGAEIEHSAIKAGITTTAFQELSFAAKQSGVESGGLDAALIRMNRALSLASTGGKTQNDTLRALGLSFEQLQGLAPDKQFEILADRISKLTSPADRARAEIVLFGRAGGELGALLSKGAAGIEEMRRQAESLGGVISEENVKKLEESHQAIERLESSFSKLAATLVGSVAPALTGVLDDFARLASGQKDVISQTVIDNLSRQIEEQSGAGGDSRLLRQLRIAKEGLLLKPSMILKSEDLQSASNFRSLLGANAPGYQATEIPDLSVHPLLKGQKIDRVGMGALLDQWNQETVRVQDQAAGVYDRTMLKLKELFNAGVIDLQEYQRRVSLATSKFNESLDTLQPIQITAKKIFPIDGLELGIRQFTSDFDSAMMNATHQSGSFARNFLYNILTALEDRAIYSAIDDIGKALERTLTKSGESGGWMGLLASALGLGSFGGAGAGAAAAAASGSGGVVGLGGPLAKGGFAASNKTYLVGERGPELFTPSGSGVVTPNDQLGGGGMTFAPTYNINAPNGDQQLRNALPSLLAAMAARTKRDMLEAFRRNNLPSPRTA